MNLSPDTLALLLRILQKGQQQPMPMQRMGVQGAMPQQPQMQQQFPHRLAPHWIGVRG